MKTLLICPAIRPALPQLADLRPLATFPILGECLVNHWVEHLAALGAREVIIVAADRAAQVRAAVGDGERWGVRIEVIESGLELTVAEAVAKYQSPGGAPWLPAPNDVILMSHLPGCAESPLFDSYASWFAGVAEWMPRALTPARVRVSEIRPGIWVGRRARVSPRAQLIAPCWIGDQVFVGPRAVIGPGAVIEDRAVVEVGARVTQSYVARDTFVGRMTSVVNSLALGSTLINWQTDSSLRVPDPFLLCSLARPAELMTGNILARMGQALGRYAGAPFNLLAAWTARSRRASELKLPG
jgi:NDP-sugar pyrophosphorylase family protein